MPSTYTKFGTWLKDGVATSTFIYQAVRHIENHCICSCIFQFRLSLWGILVPEPGRNWVDWRL